MSIDWTSSYEVDWKIYKVNPDTWDEAEMLENAMSVSVNKDCTDDVPLLETSSITVDLGVNEDFSDGWYRTVAFVSQNGTYEMYPIATQWYEITDDVVDYGVARATVRGQSVLLPATEHYMRNGDFLPKGANAAEWAYLQLIGCLKCPVYLEGDGFILNQFVVYDEGDSVLSAVWHALDAGKWCLQIDGRGVVRIMKRPELPTLSIDVTNRRLLQPGVQRSRGKADVPNRYVAKDGDFEESVVNDDPGSPSSTVNVGRVITADLDTNPMYIDNESLWTYVRRRLEELSTKSRTYSYKREYHPDIRPLDIINVFSEEDGLRGYLRVSTQQLTLDNGISVSETGVEEEKLWRA